MMMKTDDKVNYLKYVFSIMTSSNIVWKMFTCQKNIIWISGYHFMKGISKFDLFHKIWKPYLEWYTSTSGVEYLKMM